MPNLFMFYYPDFRADQLMGTARHAPDVVVDISSVIDKKREARVPFGATQTRPGEDRDERMHRFQERVEGAAGYMHGFEYKEQFVRWNPERVQYLPMAD